MFSPEILQAASRLTRRCLDLHVRLVLAESCTGGLLAAAMTALPGASRVLDRAFVCYSYDAKEQELGVPRALSEEHGAVSQPVAQAMAVGALQRVGNCNGVSLAVTGVAGPEASQDKPVGLVFVALARHGTAMVRSAKFEFGSNDRDAVRQQTVLAALRFAAECLCS